MRRELSDSESKKEAMNHTVMDLISILVEEGGTAASFVFRNDENHIVATVGIALYEDAYRLREIFNENFKGDN